jgi:hypothetical protein
MFLTAPAILPSRQTTSNELSWGQKLDELTPAARNAGRISAALRAKYGRK